MLEFLFPIFFHLPNDSMDVAGGSDLLLEPEAPQASVLAKGSMDRGRKFSDGSESSSSGDDETVKVRERVVRR